MVNKVFQENGEFDSSKQKVAELEKRNRARMQVYSAHYNGANRCTVYLNGYRICGIKNPTLPPINGQLLFDDGGDFGFRWKFGDNEQVAKAHLNVENYFKEREEFYEKNPQLARGTADQYFQWED